MKQFIPVIKNFVPAGFLGFHFRYSATSKKAGQLRHVITRWLGDNLPDYYYLWKNEQIRKGSLKNRRGWIASDKGNVQFVCMKEYHALLREAKIAWNWKMFPSVGKNHKADMIRAQCIHGAIRQFKPETLVRETAPKRVLIYSDGIAERHALQQEGFEV